MRSRRFLLFFIAAGLFAQPQRIVSTAPSITELLYALGLGDRVAGVTRYCTYPPEALKKPKIGDYVNPNVEAIAALKPDLVIVQTNPVRLAERLRRLHLNVLEIDQRDLAAIYESIREVGQATGAAARATELIDRIRGGLEEVRARAAKLNPEKMMLVVGRRPGRLDGLIVTGRSSYLNEIIRIAGGENVFGDARAAYPQVSLEEVLARDPRVIVDMGDMGDDAAIPAARQREVIELWQRLPSLAAVREHRVYAISSGGFLVPGPRVVEAARELFAALHPESK
ncbi:MAG TPA: cobalamin-binding protein [Bryobacteraceae bacterium]|jgi:iron complex transport system substrate-binding protein|nr:cobalamin-binding protein [Bryobacteraceae bacterium]